MTRRFFSIHAGSLVVLGLILTTPSCNDNAPVDEDAALDAVQDETADDTSGLLGAPCRTRADCAQNLDCGPPSAPQPGCGEGWVCTDEQLCSAAPGAIYCICEGVARWLAAGCPGQDSVGPIDAVDFGDVEGQACDPSNLDDFRTDLIVTGTGFDAIREAPDGRVIVAWTRPDGATGSVGQYIDEAGTFVDHEYNVVDPKDAGEWRVEVFADFNSDGRCDAGAGDRIWVLSANAQHTDDIALSVMASNPGNSTECEALKP